MKTIVTNIIFGLLSLVVILIVGESYRKSEIRRLTAELQVMTSVINTNKQMPISYMKEYQEKIGQLSSLQPGVNFTSKPRDEIVFTTQQTKEDVCTP